MIVEPKIYKLSGSCTPETLTKAGFEPRGNKYKLNKVLYKTDDTSVPYVTLKLEVEDGRLSEWVIKDDGSIYAPFYNYELRHNNLVYEKVATAYNTFMHSLVRKKIVKEEVEKHGRNGNKRRNRS